MDLYTLNPGSFTALNPIDEFLSALWVERYSVAGETRILVSDTAKNRKLLKEGTYVRLRGSDEVAQILTQSAEKGVLTCVGPMLTKAVLNERLAWFSVDGSITSYTDKTRKPGEFISKVVDMMAITSPGPDYGGAQKLQWAFEMIDVLSLGAIDHSGTAKLLECPIGFLYDSIQPIAENEGVGIQLYLAAASETSLPDLRFRTYQGLDRTSDQDVNPLIRLSPNTETLSGLKELNSIDGYKNVVYVRYANVITTHYEDPDNIPEGLARRVLIHDAEGAPEATGRYGGDPRHGYPYSQPYVTPDDVVAFRAQRARDALANNNYIRLVDGQTNPDDEFQFGIHYGLGDIIELQSFSGVISKARATEYIRSEDPQGEKNYPTLSVLDADNVETP